MNKPKLSKVLFFALPIAAITVFLLVIIAGAGIGGQSSTDFGRTKPNAEPTFSMLTTPSPTASVTTPPSEELSESSTANSGRNGNDGVYNMYKGQTGFVVASASPDGYSFTLVEMCTTGWVRFSVVTDTGSTLGTGGGSCEIGKYGMAGHGNSGMSETAKSWFCSGSMTGNSFRAVSENGSVSQWFPVFVEWKICPQMDMPNSVPVG